MWRAEAFTGKLPHVATRRPPKAWMTATTSKTRLSAVNSRELRFLSGANVASKQQEQQKKQLQEDLEHAQSFATSLPQYFFANSNGELMMNLMQKTLQQQHQQHQEKETSNRRAPKASSSASRFPDRSYTHTETIYSSSSTVSTTTIRTQTSTTTFSNTTPQSLLLSQQTFRRAFSSSTNNNGIGNMKNGQEEEPLFDESLGGEVNGISNKDDGGISGKNNDVVSAQESVVNGVAKNTPSPASQAPKRQQQQHPLQYPPPRQGYGYSIQLSDEEKALFRLLRQVHQETGMTTTLRVAGGWVRDKLLATPEFQIFHHDFNSYYSAYGKRLTSKFKSSTNSRLRSSEQPSMGRKGTKILSQDDLQGPVDIDIALDTMLGREFADHLNEYLQEHGKDTVSVGVVLKNPEKSKHLETATMKVGSFWIDFVNLRAEEYAEDSRIPDLMRIGTASEDAFRRDLTINSLFYNINTGQVEDWTGRGFADLRRGIVATPLAPLTTLLDDPLRVLRSIRFAARLRFTIGDELVAAAKDSRVRMALAQKVSRERVGGEVDLMLRSPDPVGAMRLLINLNLVETVFPVEPCLPAGKNKEVLSRAIGPLFNRCLELLSTTHDHLFDCKISPPIWCQSKRILTTHNVVESPLTSDDEVRRLLWYAAFLKPIHDYGQHLKLQEQTANASKRAGRKANRSFISKLLVDELKRPSRDVESVEKIMKAANDISNLIRSGCDLSATLVLISDVRVTDNHGTLIPTMRGRTIDSVTEGDPVWEHAMEFRLLCSQVLRQVDGLWRAALMLSLSEQLASLNDDGLDYTIEGDIMDESKEERRQGIIEQYDTFAAALQQIGLIGIWGATSLVDGKEMKEEVLPYIPRGPAFRDVMDEQERWITTHPGASKEPLVEHLRYVFPDFAKIPSDKKAGKQPQTKKTKNVSKENENK